MNKLFRLVWNRARQKWIVASEKVASKGSIPARTVGALCAAAALAGAAGTSFALPSGNTLVAGQAIVTNPSAGQMQINQASNRAIINWQSFGIAGGEAVNISQPSAQAALLNRVIGNSSSEIFGRLTANGQVFLVNPNGILFGKGSEVNVGGLVASTLNIKNDDFMNGNLKFYKEGASGSVVNQGIINGTFVSMLGSRAENSGTITATKSAALVAADAVTLSIDNTGLLAVQVEQGAYNAQVQNSGIIEADGGRVILTAKSADDILRSAVNNTGIIRASSITTKGGEIIIQGGNVSLEGAIEANGTSGGTVQIQVDLLDTLGTITANGTTTGGTITSTSRSHLHAGSITANGTTTGGAVDINATQAIIVTDPATITANSTTGTAGRVYLNASPEGGQFISGAIEATGVRGGDIRLLGGYLSLVDGYINAKGASQGGSILVGGDYQGKNPDIPNAKRVAVNGTTILDASATDNGNGGKVIVWSDGTTSFKGLAKARGGETGGNGGFIEVSGKDSVIFGGMADAGAAKGKAGTFLLDPKNITITDAVTTGYLVTDLADPFPASNDQHGNGLVTELSNGSIVVVSQYDNFGASQAGAVYLYSGSTGALISMLHGSTASDLVGFGGVTALSNGNYVVSSYGWDNGAVVNAGAVTWGSGATGVSGAVSVANSLVGSTASDQVGSRVTALSNGNYVVGSYMWDNGAVVNSGAATWGSGTTGITGAVSAANSLVGTTAEDQLGLYVTALTNGNYVVTTPTWDNGGVVDAGAATWGNGTTGITGVVSAANSLVGSTANDQVGYAGGIALTNGNYVVASRYWDNGAVNDAGAVTWGSGTSGITGAVSAANSLVGGAASDQVGSGGVTSLSNGNYVVSSYGWDNGAVVNAGAVTWGSGATGVSGAVSAANSLVGSTASDLVGPSVTALSNGNYVVRSPSWDNGAVVNAGAATWGSGTTGITGAVSAANSLVGTTAEDQLGLYVTALTNGNYVVTTPTWDNGGVVDAGAATWGNGTTGITGVVSAANSLVGSTANDQVGYAGGIALTNGNYVVASRYWDNGAVNDAGAVTWGSGTSGITGAVSAANSLVGGAASDQVGSGGVTSLSNGNFVVSSINWDNGAVNDAGAATWGSGTTGITGVVSAANSLVGSTANDLVGPSVTALSNGNYVVRSPSWDNGAVVNAGAATWGNGTTGISGAVSAANSLVGSTASDQVGSGGITALTNGNYVVSSYNWDNVAVVNAGAATWGNGTTGISGAVSAANSLVGSTASDHVGSGVTALTNGNYVVRSPYYNSGGLTDNGAVWLVSGFSSISSPLAFSNQPGGTGTISPGQITAITNTGTAVVLQANNDITVSSAITSNNPGGNGGALTMQAGRSIFLNANIFTDNGNLNIYANERLASGVVDAYRDAGNAVITMGAGTSLNAGTGDVNIETKDGLGKTSKSSDNISLYAITANNVSIANNGPSAGSGIVLNGAVNAANSILAVSGNANISLGAGSSLTAGGTGNALVLAGQTFLNQAGATPLSAASGRWLIYSADPAGNTFGGMASPGNAFNRTYTANPPGHASISSLTGNRFIYSITPTLNITADAKSKTYGASDPALTYAVSGLVSGDTTGSTLSGALSRAAGETVAGGPYAINQGTLTNGLGYSISYTGASLTIDPAALGITASNATKTYGDAVVFAGTEFTSTGLKNGEAIGTVTLASAGAAASAGVAGSPYNITASNATGGTFTAGNYTISYNNGSLTVNPAAITVTASNQNRTYGSANPTSGAVTLTGGTLYNGDTLSTATVTAQGTATATANAGSTHTLTPSAQTFSAGSAGNYTITYSNGTLSITPAALGITASNASKTYGDAVVFAGSEFTSSGLKNGETIGSVTLTSAGAVATAGVAGSPYSITPSNATGGTFTAGNYTITYNNGSLTVNPAAITVTASNQNRTYGSANPTSGAVTLTGGTLYNGDTLSTATVTAQGTATATANAGTTHTLTPSAQTFSAGSAGNYTITYSNGTLTITPAALGITADNATKTYGDAVVFAGTEFTSTGLKNGETIGSVTLASAGAVATAGVAGSPYSITPSNATGGTFTAGNYTISYNNGQLTITPKGLTVTGATAQNKVYDGTTTAGINGATLNGIVGADDVTAGGTGNFANRNVGTGKAVTAALTLGGTAAGNYTLTQPVGLTADITARTINITADAKSKVAGTTDPAFTYGIGGLGLGAGDSMTDTLIGLLARASGESAGAYQINQGTLAATSNYTIGTYTPADLTITAASPSFSSATVLPDMPFSMSLQSQIASIIAQINQPVNQQQGSRQQGPVMAGGMNLTGSDFTGVDTIQPDSDDGISLSATEDSEQPGNYLIGIAVGENENSQKRKNKRINRYISLINGGVAR